MKKLVIFTSEECSMRYACSAIEGKWKLPMIYILCENGTLRYNELKKSLGITNMMLSNTLKELEQEGLVNRTQYNEIPPRVEYSLTDLAMELVPVLNAFAAWGDSYHQAEARRLAQMEACQAEDKETGTD